MFYQIIQITKKGKRISKVVAECNTAKEACVTRSMFSGIHEEQFIIKEVKENGLD